MGSDNKYGVSFECNENVLKLDNGAACTTLNINTTEL